uniref:Uncharacterized protein n=1 Tax=Anopheles maculatus TaxID=74869 RepID=A0A182SIX5_9DIPT
MIETLSPPPPPPPSPTPLSMFRHVPVRTDRQRSVLPGSAHCPIRFHIYIQHYVSGTLAATTLQGTLHNQASTERLNSLPPIFRNPNISYLHFCRPILRAAKGSRLDSPIGGHD